MKVNTIVNLRIFFQNTRKRKFIRNCYIESISKFETGQNKQFQENLFYIGMKFSIFNSILVLVLSCNPELSHKFYFQNSSHSINLACDFQSLYTWEYYESLFYLNESQFMSHLRILFSIFDCSLLSFFRLLIAGKLDNIIFNCVLSPFFKLSHSG